jgi:hypothetical protein
LVIQGPAGKFVSKLLKPVIACEKYIIHGLKDLAIKLSKLHLLCVKTIDGVQKKLYLVTGDVVVFYPHVDVAKAHAFVEAMLMQWYAEQEDINPYTAAQWIHLFWKCLSAADDDLLSMFQGCYFKQRKGLVMGVACSPNLANLYWLRNWPVQSLTVYCIQSYTWLLLDLVDI